MEAIAAGATMRAREQGDGIGERPSCQLLWWLVGMRKMIGSNSQDANELEKPVSGSTEAPSGATPLDIGKRAKATCVTVEIIAQYVEGRARAGDDLHLWAYDVIITLHPNFVGEIQLLGRHWHFTDASGNEQETDADTIMGEHPVLSWRRPVYRYRSAVALGTSTGKMIGYFKAIADGALVEIPVGNIELDQKNSLHVTTPPPLPRSVPESDQKQLLKLFRKYKGLVDKNKPARLNSSEFPASLRARLENWILKHQEFNEKKRAEHDFSNAIGDLNLKIKLPKTITTDMFVNEDIDNLNITFLYEPMDSNDALKSDLDAVLLKHGVVSEDRRSVLVRELCTRIETTSVLPKKAPKLYADRPAGQNIIDFLRDPEGWGPYVKTGRLSRADLGRLDPQAYMALSNWCRNKEIPSDLKIPTKKQKTDRIAAQFDGSEAERPARVVWALQKRTRKAKPD